MQGFMLRMAMGFFPGSKSLLAGIGLIGLGAYSISQGHIDNGLASLAQGLGLIGIRAAIGNNSSSILQTGPAEKN